MSVLGLGSDQVQAYIEGASENTVALSNITNVFPDVSVDPDTERVILWTVSERPVAENKVLVGGVPIDCSEPSSVTE